MNPNLHLIIGHAINTLPDSIRARRELLAALLRITPISHPLRERIQVLSIQLETHEANQLSLALEFRDPKFATVANLKNDGDGNGQNKNP